MSQLSQLPPFAPFAALIKKKFDEMSKGELFVSGNDSDVVWELYLSRFPEGTNPAYRTRTEHDCSCCKQFVRNIGNVVSIKDGKLTSVWDIVGAEYPFNEVAAAMAEYVNAQPITSLYRVSERKYGAESTIELLAGGATQRWDHFHGQIAPQFLSTTVGKDRGDYINRVVVFKRGLKELTADAFDTVIELIHGKSLYRGEEHLWALQAFQKLQKQYLAHIAANGNADHFVWANASNSAAVFRNTVIGTLIQDLSAGMPLEQAVRAFESKVAPANYKRTTALTTPRMREDALKTIKLLGLELALDRRRAKLSDVSINNVQWVDNSVQAKMKDGVEGLLMGIADNTKATTDKAEKITIDEFVVNVLPQVATMELFVAGSLQPNFMSLTAPVHPDSGKLFKWNNDFGWSYDGNITDSIKEKVKRAGGKTDAAFRVSLAWFNFDDLDIQVVEPDGNMISFRNKRSRFGMLDVDMNAGQGTSREPVENVTWDTPPDGNYVVKVNNWHKREASGEGFVIEVENNGQLAQFSYGKAVRDGNTITVGTIKIVKGVIAKIDFIGDMVGGGISQEKWGITTETFVKVNTLMKSPNHWDSNQIGNKHWFFMLDKCLDDTPTRGIYNEFLTSELDKHRKVFELLGDMTKCPPTDDQLCGVGFSSTKHDSVIVKVAGNKLRKTYSITF